MISKDKTYRTRDGREVRIYATDAGTSARPIHGAVRSGTFWSIHCWWGDGSAGTEASDLDLIEVKPRIKRTVWLHIYRDTTVASDTTIQRRTWKPLACVKVEIDCEEGEGL
jgi:hypothetical protein